jgi:SAM-dependent methyltransferase
MNQALPTVIAKRGGDHYEGPSEWRDLCGRDRSANIVSACKPIPHDTVLEIGCGEGAVLAELSRQGFARALFGCELSKSGVEVTLKRNIPALKDCKVADGCDLPYPDGSFDLAILAHVVEHVEDPRAVLKEAARVARHVYIEVPLELRWRMRRNYADGFPGHVNFYSARSFRLLVQTSDLRVVRQVVTQPSWDAYRYQYGTRGKIGFVVKAALLKICPPLATAIFTYHGFILAASEAE